MPHYRFHVHNGNGLTCDEEGLDVEDVAAARQVAVESIRSFIADDAREGRIDLRGHIEVADERGDCIIQVPFPEAFDLQLPGDPE